MSSLYTNGTTFSPDKDEAEYLLWSGSFPGGNGGLQDVAKQFAPRLLEGSLKVDVVDPTLANGLVTATMPGINWIPIKPATNGALYAAIAQYLIENKTYTRTSCPIRRRRPHGMPAGARTAMRRIWSSSMRAIPTTTRSCVPPTLG